MRQSPKHTPLFLTSLLALSLMACSPKLDPAAELAQVKESLAANDLNSAGIRLRSLLAHTDSMEARFLFGKVLLSLGEPGLAVVELDKALTAGAEKSTVLPLLAQALAQSGQSRSLIERFDSTRLDNEAADIDLQLALLQAHTVLGRRADVDGRLAALVEKHPRDLKVKLFRARTVVDAGDVDGALKLVNDVLAQQPKNVEALRLLGDLHQFGKLDLAKARAAYEQALVAQPNDLESGVRLTHLLIQQRELAAAEQQFAKLKKQRLPQQQSKLIEALLFTLSGKHKQAGEAIQVLLQRGSDVPWVLELAGANAMAVGELTVAEGYLNKAIKLNPGSEQARGMLARVYIRVGAAAKALDTLAPLLKVDKPGAGVLSLAGEANLVGGDSARAKALFEQAAARQPDEATFRLGKAKALWASGLEGPAFSELDKLVGGSSGIEAQFLRVQYLVSGGKLAEAAEAAAALEAKRPGAAYVANLRGDIALRSNKSAEAKAFFDQAAQRDPKFFPAVAGLAALDISSGDADAGHARLKAFIAAQPRNVDAYLALADALSLDPKRAAEVSGIYADARVADPTDVRPAVALIKHLLKRRDFAKASEVAQDAGARFSQFPAMLDQQAQAFFATGDTQRALSALGQWGSLQPNSPEPQMRTAELWMARADYAAAAAAYRRARALGPDPLPAAAGEVRALLLAGNRTAALALAREIEAKLPANPQSARLVGDVHVTDKNFTEAIAAYRRGLQNGGDLALREKLFQTQLAAGRRDEAEKGIVDWVTPRAADVGLAFAAGQTALATKDWAAAERFFSLVLKHKPDDAPSMNNLAWALSQQGRPGALAWAKQATERMPNTAPFLDTLAHVLVAEGRLPEGVEAQRKAVAAAGASDGKFRLELARILIKAGQSAAAAEEIQRVKSTAIAGSAEALAADALLRQAGTR